MSDSLKLKPLHPVATLLNHLRLIVVVTGVLTLIFGAVVLFKVRPTYLSEAAIEVNLLYSRLLTYDHEKQFSSRTQYTDFVHTQVSYIVGFENVMATLNSLDLSQTALATDEEEEESDTFFRFIKMLRVEPVKDTHLISIAVEDNQPDGLAILANTLVDSYMARMEAVELGKNDSRVQHLRDELERKRNGLKAKQDQLTSYSLNLGTLNMSRETNPHDDSLATLRDALNLAIVDRVEAENTYLGLKDWVGSVSELGVAPLVEELVNADPSTVEMKNRTIQTNEELDRESAIITPNHPNHKRLEMNAERSKKYLESMIAETRRNASAILTDKMKLENERELLTAQSNFVTALKNEQDVREHYERELATLKQVIPPFLKARQLIAEIENDEFRITQVESRLEELIIEAKEPGRIHIQSRARDPILPTKDRRKLFLAMAGFLALTIALLLAFVMDYFQPSVIDPKHMSIIIGSRPTGMLPHRVQGNFCHLIREDPDCYHSDLFRRMMPRIFKGIMTTEKPQILAVMSLTQGEGVTSFALNCMSHFQRVGHPFGLLEIASGPSKFTQTIEPWGLQEEPLDTPFSDSFPLVMHAGSGLECYHFQRSCGKEGLSDPEQLRPFLQSLASRTGCLLIDTPPLFENSEAEVVCQLADTVILLVNGPRIASRALSRGMTLLEELGVQKCAVIANDMPVLPGGYFTKAMAAYEGKDLKHPLYHDTVKAIRRALDPRNTKW